MGWKRGWVDNQLCGVVLTLGIFAATSACGGRSTQRHEGEPPEEEAAGERLYVLNFGSADISGFDIDVTGALSPLSGSPFPVNGSPHTAAVAPSGRTLYVGAEDRIASYDVDASSGALTLSRETKTGASVDAIAVSPSGSAVYVAHCSEHGGAISVVPILGDHQLAELPSQSVPTAFCINGIAIDPLGHFLYVSSQYGDEGALEGFVIDRPSGALTPVAGSPFGSFLAVAIAIDPRGKHVYVCDQDGLVRSYAVDTQTGELVAHGFEAETGGNPFSMVIDRQGHRLFVGNWSSGSVSSYALDTTTGLPSEAQGSAYPSGRAPHVLAIDASGRFVYVNDDGSPAIEVLGIGNAGELHPIAGSPFTAGAEPTAAVVVP